MKKALEGSDAELRVKSTALTHCNKTFFSENSNQYFSQAEKIGLGFLEADFFLEFFLAITQGLVYFSRIMPHFKISLKIFFLESFTLSFLFFSMKEFT